MQNNRILSQRISICHVVSAVHHNSRVEDCSWNVVDAGCYLLTQNFCCRRLYFSDLSSPLSLDLSQEANSDFPKSMHMKLGFVMDPI